MPAERAIVVFIVAQYTKLFRDRVNVNNWRCVGERCWLNVGYCRRNDRASAGAPNNTANTRTTRHPRGRKT